MALFMPQRPSRTPHSRPDMDPRAGPPVAFYQVPPSASSFSRVGPTLGKTPVRNSERAGRSSFHGKSCGPDVHAYAAATSTLRPMASPSWQMTRYATTAPSLLSRDTTGASSLHSSASVLASPSSLSPSRRRKQAAPPERSMVRYTATTDTHAALVRPLPASRVEPSESDS